VDGQEEAGVPACQEHVFERTHILVAGMGRVQSTVPLIPSLTGDRGYHWGQGLGDRVHPLV
jgi:hypothetical protein